MQEQLGLRRQRDQDTVFAATAIAAVVGVVASTAIDTSELPPQYKVPLGTATSAMPFALLGAGLALPSQLSQTALLYLRRRDPSYRRRTAYHEAAHFLVGYVLGMEIRAYSAGTSNGAPAEVEFGMGSGMGSLSHASLDALAVLSMAGIAGEVVACGDAQGGFTDVAQLRGLMSAASPQISSRPAQDDRIRWAMLMALTLVMRHRAALDRLVSAFEGEASVGECIEAIELDEPSAHVT